ncbi:J-domain-containing protein [Nocardia inohanensis]|uniref:DnaJ family domain-containing protein n=1 Tax=Nocardia inohanensis TaxID=209246 RepID=UPI00082C0B44|nr:DUF1992 domain-containing protein [Nocardia inohanensis]
MTERKPPDLTFESWIDKQIRESTERGEFENLPGAGQPIPPGAADEDWWLRSALKREGLSADALLPESIVLRRDRERLLDTVRGMRSEREVREAVSELNDRIVRWLRMPSGPPVPIAPVKLEEVVAQWTAERGAARVEATKPRTVRDTTDEQRGSHWWRRIFSRTR